MLEEEVSHLAVDLKKGKIGIFPCDTVWGFLGIATEDVAHRLYHLKQRPTSLPMIVLIPNKKWLIRLQHTLNTAQVNATQTMWPGPITLVLPRPDWVVSTVTGGADTVACRFPHFDPLNRLLDQLDYPVMSTSVNRSGESPLHEPSEIQALWGDKVDFFEDRWVPPLRKPSVIWDYTVAPPRMIRS